MKVENESAGKDFVANPVNVRQNMRRWFQINARIRHVARMHDYKVKRLLVFDLKRLVSYNVIKKSHSLPVE